MRNLFPILLAVVVLSSGCDQQGQGVKTVSFGDNEYVGELKDGEPNGQGTMTWISGNKYVGEWQNGKIHGVGTKTWISGNKYVGEWKDNKRHGQGVFTYASGKKYVGEFKDGEPNGQGTMTFTSGDKYVGEWKDNNPHGYGTMTWQNPWEEYVGEYKDGKIHGQGKFTKADGTVKEGLWKAGDFIEWIDGDFNEEENIEEENVRVPWLIGLTLSDATQRLINSSLSVGYVEYGDSIFTKKDSLRALVVSQFPKSSARHIKAGSEVDLFFE